MYCLIMISISLQLRFLTVGLNKQACWRWSHEEINIICKRTNKNMNGYALTKHLLLSVAALNVLLKFSRVNQKNDMHVHTLSKCEKQLIILMEAGGTTD